MRRVRLADGCAAGVGVPIQAAAQEPLREAVEATFVPRVFEKVDVDGLFGFISEDPEEDARLDEMHRLAMTTRYADLSELAGAPVRSVLRRWPTKPR